MRLIDADEIVKVAFIVERDGEICDVVVALSEIEDAPTIDPVKHGHWITDKVPQLDMRYYQREPDAFRVKHCCSVCGEEEESQRAFCPHCGARMDEVSE